MDPGGLEKYKALSKNFYKESFVVVLVYEIINKKSFDAIKNYWYKEAINYSSAQYFLLLVINVIYKKINKFLMLMVKSMQRKLMVVLKLTSASFDIGIKGLFQSIRKKVLRLIMMNKSNK